MVEELLVINGLTKKRKRREVNRIPLAGLCFSFAVFDKLAFTEPFTR